MGRIFTADHVYQISMMDNLILNFILNSFDFSNLMSTLALKAKVILILMFVYNIC